MTNSNILKKLKESNVFWAVVSLLASLIIWVYVTGTENDTVSVTFRGVQLELTGEDTLADSQNLVVTDVDTSTVTVVVEGPRRIVTALSASDISAQIDVSKIKIASYTSLQYTISYPAGTNTADLRVVSKSPETVSFVTSMQTSKQVTVRGSFDGSLADDYTAEMPVFEPSTITISGPEAYLKNVSYAWVSFGEANVDSTYSVETGYTLMDASGNECSTAYLTCSDDVVTATLPILRTKEVPLSVNIVPGGGATEENVVVSIEPKSISLAGDSEILDGLNKITVATINLGDFTSSFTDTYTIAIDNSLKNLTGIIEAKVTVEIVGLETKTFTVSNISCINVTDGYKAEIITQSLDVTLRGPADELSQIQNENVRAVADIDDFKESEGDYVTTVKIYADGYSDVGALGEYSITIELRKDTGIE